MEKTILLSFWVTLDPFVFKLITSLCAAFIGITFLQSAIDKIINYQGNKSYFQSQFAKSPLKNSVAMLLPVLTVLELFSGLGCLLGIILCFAIDNSDVILYGLSLSSITFLSLLFGQRVAKDYAGAASLTGYFIVAVIGMFALGMVVVHC